MLDAVLCSKLEQDADAIDKAIGDFLKDKDQLKKYKVREREEGEREGERRERESKSKWYVQEMC